MSQTDIYPLHQGDKVRAYRNLNAAKSGKPEWSIKKRVPHPKTGKPAWLLAGYRSALWLEMVTAKTSEAGAARIQAKGQREVIAWLNGTYAGEDDAEVAPVDMARVTYNPFRSPLFHLQAPREGEPVRHDPATEAHLCSSCHTCGEAPEDATHMTRTDGPAYCSDECRLGVEWTEAEVVFLGKDGLMLTL